MPIRLIAAVLVCVVVSVTGVAQDKPKDDSKAIQGDWAWDPAEKQSDALPPATLDRIVIKGDKLIFHYRIMDKPSISETKFKLDPKASPKKIDFTPTEGANKGKTYLGLYELKDGRLKICYRGPGSSRPKDFNDKLDGNDATTFIFLKTGAS
jgi:uncharacterized protein (TIGR03067 family)